MIRNCTSIICLIGLGCGALVLPRIGWGQDSDLEDRVRNTAREMGTIESSTRVRIASPVNGTILRSVADGTAVSKNDQLAVIDDQQLREELQTLTLRLTTATAHVEQAKLEYEAARSQAAGQHKVFQLELEVAKARQDAMLGDEGELQQELEGLKDVIAVAQLKLKTARALAGAGQAKQDLVAEEEATRKISRAEARIKLLEGPLKRLKQVELELAVSRAAVALESHQVSTQRALLTAEAALAAQAAERESIKQKMENLSNRIVLCRIKAPLDGIASWIPAGRGTPPLTAGAQVRERQPLMEIVDPAKLQMKVLVHETVIGRVKLGQEVKLSVDAFFDRKWRGRVSHINSVPEPTSFLQDGGKKYSVMVSFDDAPDGLRIGLTGLAEIQLAEIQRDADPGTDARKSSLAQFLGRYDKNNDGKLSNSELSELPDAAKKLFEQLDADGDGAVSVEELRKIRRDRRR